MAGWPAAPQIPHEPCHPPKKRFLTAHLQAETRNRPEVIPGLHGCSLGTKKDSTPRAAPSHPLSCRTHPWPGRASLSDPAQENSLPGRDRAAMEVLFGRTENFSVIQAGLSGKESTGLSRGDP